MYESKGGLCCFNLKSGQFPSIDFHTFFRYLATESMGPKQFPVVLFHKAANYCKLTKFRCFKNRTARLRISFRDALKFVAFNFRRCRIVWKQQEVFELHSVLNLYVCHSHQFSRPGLTSPILDSRSSILASRFPILDSQFPILHSQFSILDPRSSILASRFSILDPRSSILDSRFSTLDSQFSSLDISRFSILDNIRTSLHGSR